jgi:hypothetical protein
MTMTFRYFLAKTRRPVHSLGGRQNRPRTLIPFCLTGPAGIYVKDGLLDTGADDTVFEEDVAARVGIDLTNAPEGEVTGVAAAATPVRYALATLRVSDGRESREWDAWVGFTAAKLRHPLLGFAGFLQFFDAHFFGQREEVELTVNGMYPGK